MANNVERANQIAGAGDGDTKKERREQLRHLQKEAFQLANYYFVFQGVIFTAFYNSPSKLKCRYHWIPFSLSFLAGILNLFALSSIAFQYKSTLDARDSNATDTRRVNGDLPGPLRGLDEANSVKCERNWRTFYVVVCMGLFFGFFVITLIGCWTITCNDHPQNTAQAQPPK